jgi:hypothetical protein
MSDIETYLADLRSHLRDLDPRRGEEIIAEARSHLAAEAAKLQQLGASPEAADAEAVRILGEPGPLAVRLVAANSQHSTTGVFRTLTSLAILWGTIFVVVVGSDVWEQLLPVHSLLALAMLVAPGAVLSGMVVGRRRWWVPGLAPAVLYGVFVLAIAWAELLTGRWEDGRMALIVLSVALLVGAFSFVGSRVRITKRARRPVGMAAGAYLLGVTIVAMTNLRDAVGVLAFIAVVQAVIGILALAAVWDRHRWRSWVLWAGAPLLSASIVAMVVLGTYRAFQAKASEHWTALVVGQATAWIILLTLCRFFRAKEQAGKRLPDRI